MTACLRTAFTKGGKGGFKDTAAADLLVGAFKSLIERSKIDPGLVEDIAVGSVLPPGGGATEFRAAALAAGFPVSAAVRSLNRQCSSGLQACVDIANAISAGMIEIGVGAGVESMSLQYGYVYHHVMHLDEHCADNPQTWRSYRVLGAVGRTPRIEELQGANGTFV